MDAKQQTTINLLRLLVVIAAVCTATKSTHESDSLLQEETDVSRYSQYCYSCSSDTALCDEVVYDGHFLTAVPCKTSCFLRREDNVTYRGCFDGWLGGMVRNDYVGCRTQVYFGRAVEWCFCNSPASGRDAPCNGQSRDVIAQNAASYGGRQSYPQHSGGYGPGGDRAYVGGQVAKSGYDVYQEEYPHINTAADKYEGARGELYSCKDKRDGSYHDPDDCARYYQCSSGYSYHRSCPEGTQWNQVLQTCAFSFHPRYPCRRTPYAVTSRPRGTPEPVQDHRKAKLREQRPKKTKDMAEFYHYF